MCKIIYNYYLTFMTFDKVSFGMCLTPSSTAELQWASDCHVPNFCIRGILPKWLTTNVDYLQPTALEWTTYLSAPVAVSLTAKLLSKSIGPRRLTTSLWRNPGMVWLCWTTLEMLAHANSLTSGLGLCSWGYICKTQPFDKKSWPIEVLHFSQIWEITLLQQHLSTFNQHLSWKTKKSARFQNYFGTIITKLSV